MKDMVLNSSLKLALYRLVLNFLGLNDVVSIYKITKRCAMYVMSMFCCFFCICSPGRWPFIMLC